jgi:hypothetical protein
MLSFLLLHTLATLRSKTREHNKCKPGARDLKADGGPGSARAIGLTTRRDLLE